jgi:antitoxin component of MazEF toxin-antitoxin module
MTIPRSVRTAVGVADGDLIEVKVVGRKIIITPTLVIDRSKFPASDDEYTPEQRRMIDARLREAEKGPFFGPFKNGVEVAAFLKKNLRDQGRTKAAKSRRSKAVR